MTHVIASLCLRDNGCIDVCPVECISAGEPVEQWPTFYNAPGACIVAAFASLNVHFPPFSLQIKSPLHIEPQAAS